MAQSSNSNSLLDTSSINTLENVSVGIVYTEWNEAIVQEQIKGAENVLSKIKSATTLKLPVPGSFEIPFACKRLAEEKDLDVIIAFGAVIQGGTPHFDYVCKAVTEGITSLNTSLSTPIIFGVLTLDNEEQAWERLGGSHGHKGEEAAITALKMVAFNRNLKNS